MGSETKKIILKSICCGFLLAALASWYAFAAAAAKLPENIVRLHVVANSDSEADQAVKLLVRDAVLEEAARWCSSAATMQEASDALCLHLEAIGSAADRVLAAEGVPETAKVQVTEMYFSTREYEGFTLPAGRYRTLRVTIGEGGGHNWWCVVFPALCLPAAEEKGEEVFSLLPESERDAVEHAGKYRVKFKVVELYEQLRDWLGNR